MKIKRIHRWNVSVQQAESIQAQLRNKITSKKEWLFRLRRIKIIAACDVDYSHTSSCVSISAVTFTFPELEIVEEVVERKRETSLFPYIPGLLSFREAPLLLKVIRKVKNDPQLILFDGQGIAHPQKMGLATHMGLFLDKSTIGCAKSYLYGIFQEPVNIEGSYAFLKDTYGEVIGGVIRTKKNVKPLFVSPGYRIDPKSSIEVVLSCVRGYRIPEPLRIAHFKAHNYLDKK